MLREQSRAPCDPSTWYAKAYYLNGFSIKQRGMAVVQVVIAVELKLLIIVEDAVDDAYHADTSRMRPRSCY